MTSCGAVEANTSNNEGMGVSIPRSIRSYSELIDFVGCESLLRIRDRGIVTATSAIRSWSPKLQMMILLSVTAEAWRTIRSSLALLVGFLSHLSRMAQGTDFSLVVTLEFIEILVAGGGIEPPTLGL
jgi:hypothetical protein